MTKNYIPQYLASLLPLIFHGLEITEFDEESINLEESMDDIVWSVSRAASTLLIDVAVIVRYDILKDTINFASTKLNG